MVNKIRLINGDKRMPKKSKEFLINYFDVKSLSNIRLISIGLVFLINVLCTISLDGALRNIGRSIFNASWNRIYLILGLITIWGIIVCINPKKMRFQFFLFAGISSIILSTSFVCAFIILTVYAYGFPVVLFTIIGVLFPVMIAAGRIWYRMNAFKKCKVAKRGNPYYGVIAVFSFLGLAVGRILFPKMEEGTKDIIMAFIFLLIACVFASLWELILRYSLSLKYKDELL